MLRAFSRAAAVRQLLFLGLGCPILLLTNLSPVLAQAPSCPSNARTAVDFAGRRVEGHGALEALLLSAKSTREAILSDQLPYGAIREEIRKHYNTSSLPVSPFITEWIKYSQNALYLTGFIVFVGVVLPAVMVALWTSWECCYETEDENEEESRNESRWAQIVAWSLAVVTVLLILVLIAFVAVLLAGSSLISRGASEGGEAVSSLLPEVAQVRDAALQETEEELLGRYQRVLQVMYERLGNVPKQIRETLDEIYGNKIQSFYSMVSRNLSLYDQLLSQSQLLLSHTRNLSAAANTDSADSSPESQLLEDMTNALSELSTACSDFLEEGDSNGTDLAAECTDLIGQDTYIPVISSNVSSLGGQDSRGALLLQELVQVLSSSAEVFLEQPVINVYSLYFDELTHNITRFANSSVAGYYGVESQFYDNLTTVVQQVWALNHSLSLGLPESQQQVLLFLGPRYLANWDKFRHLCTIAFALIVLLLGTCLVVAMGRGLFNIYDIYTHGEETASMEGAHQSGMMMKKLSFMLTGVSVVSAASYGTSLVLAGGMGQSCRPNGNFSELIQHVIDNTMTWNGAHLLGQAVLGNSTYPLTFERVLEGCRLNSSLYSTLELDIILDLEQEISISAEKQFSFLNDLQNIAVSPFSSLSPLAHRQLAVLADARLRSVEWEDFISLSLFSSGFVGLDGLSNKLQDMERAASTIPPLTHNLTGLLEEASFSLSALSTHLDTVLIDIHSNARTLQTTLSHTLGPTLLMETATSLENNIRVRVDEEAHRKISITGSQINQLHTDFVSSSIQRLRCQTGSCQSLYDLYAQFSTAVCHLVVPGLDLYWASLIAILTLTLCVMVLSLFLASRLVDFKKERSSKSHLIDSTVRQARGIFWFLLGIAINAWLVVAIATDEYFQEVFCASGLSGGCCPVCVWAFGILFLLVSVVVGAVSQAYQCIILHRLSKGIKKVRRYWMDKKKAAEFHGQLAVLFVQDIPFLIIAGIYTSRISMLTAPSFFSLVLSLLGIAAYLLYIFREGSNIRSYCACLASTFKRSSKFDLQGEPPGLGGSVGRGSNGGPAMAMNGRAMNGRYLGSESEHSESDSQGTTQHVDDWMYNSNHPGGHASDHRLSVIPEHMEGGVAEMPPRQPRIGSDRSSPGLPLPGRGNRSGRPGGSFSVPVYMHAQDSDSETLPSASMPLDHTSSPTESAIRQRREAAILSTEGIEVASSIGRYDTSSASYFGSKNSVMGSELQGYYSSSQPPDEMYESSDCREDYDSDYSHTNAQRNKLRLQLNGPLYYEMSVEV